MMLTFTVTGMDGIRRKDQADRDGESDIQSGSKYIVSVFKHICLKTAAFYGSVLHGFYSGLFKL